MKKITLGFIIIVGLIFLNLDKNEINAFDKIQNDIEYQEALRISKVEAKIEGIAKPYEQLSTVKDLNGNLFYIQQGYDGGFMVYDPETKNFIEKSATFQCPYNFNKEAEYYYFGPMKYYVRKNNTFQSLIFENENFDLTYANEIQAIFDEQLAAFRDSQDIVLFEKEYLSKSISSDSLSKTVSVGNKKYINNYQYIRDAIHPENNDDSCGYVAASLILNFWDKTMYKGTVLPQFLDSDGNLNNTSVYNPNVNLKDKLVEFAGGNTASWGKDVRDAMIDYAEYANLGAISSYYIGKIGLDSALENDKPVIIFGALPDEPDNNLVNHAVTAYGIEKEWWGGYYIVNYGWSPNGSDYDEVSLGMGFVGSVTHFELKENSYASIHTINQNDYGFAGAYVSTDTYKQVNADGLTFDTKRLRTGYIEEEYINLSPRKTNAGTAYLEYNFQNPVYKIVVDLSFWSDDERYYSPNKAEARIEYKRLRETSYIQALDLLNANLPTDRYNQNTYTIYFPGGTRNFRFYTHFDYMSGWTDRNKGRISIGSMDIYTYS